MEHNGTAISGATASTYTLTEGDENTTITVVASFTDDTGQATSQTSAATATVLDVAPTVTTPTITGSDIQGSTLTASATVTADESGTPSYQWQHNGTAISGATASTYTLTEGDENTTITVVASFTDDTGQATTQTSAATATVLDVAPTVTTPTITGSDIQGSTLTASATVTADEAGTPSYQWQHNGTAISGATASTYTLTEGDENTTITVVASFTDDTGQATSQTSAATATVKDVAPTVTMLTITGSDIQGSTLTASATVTADEAGTPSYQWQHNGTAISGATASTYTLTEGDENTTITVVASFTDDTGQATSQTSAATATVLDVAPTVTTPTITGSDIQGSTLTASATVTADEAGTPSYQWQHNGTAISGATASTYTLTEGDENTTITVVASFTDDTGQATSQTSAATATVLDVAPTVTTPTITGSDIQGSTLTASATVTADEAGTPSYQWQHNGTAISGATASTYTLTEGDENTTITVVASFTDDTGQATTQTSAATATVKDVAPTVTTPTITGSDIQGSTLTASATVTADEAGTPSYQWQHNGTAISGATASTYTLTEGDENTTITVVASFTDDTGQATSQTSAATATVLDVAPTVTTPTITGSDIQGSTLTASATVTADEAARRATSGSTTAPPFPAPPPPPTR